MIIHNNGKYFRNLKYAKKYAIVLFNHQTKHGQYYDENSIRKLMSDKPLAKVIIIEWCEFIKYNKGKYAEKPTDILIVGLKVCKKLKRKSQPSLEYMLSDNHKLNESLQNKTEFNISNSIPKTPSPTIYDDDDYDYDDDDTTNIVLNLKKDKHNNSIFYNFRLFNTSKEYKRTNRTQRN